MRSIHGAAAVTALVWLLGCAHAPTADERLAAALRSQPVVLLGEIHDNPEHHALRAGALAEWLATGARPTLLMEQFDRERQPDLDRTLARPGVTADDVIAAAAPADAGWNWTFYRPIVALAITYRLPLVAANVSRADTRRAIQGGLGALGFDAAIPADIAAAQAEAIVASHCGAIDVAQAGRMVAAQEARDQFMARAIETHAARGVVLLAGNGHVRRDIGVPRWLPASLQRRSVVVGMLEAGQAEPASYDVALSTAAPKRPDPCAAFRR